MQSKVRFALDEEDDQKGDDQKGDDQKGFAIQRDVEAVRRHS
jgi:hypothetical protein